MSTLQYNIMIKALHISGISNKIADSLSRCDFAAFPEPLSRGRPTRHRNTRPSLETLTTEIDSLVNVSMADSTWKTYKTAVESFQSFRNCIIYKILCPPLYMICYSTLHTCLTQACQPVLLLLTFPV